MQAIGSGDWIATIARLTGTHTGSLPAYLASAQVPATGRSFDVPHYTIARWQDGKITYLKGHGRRLAILGKLGLA